MDQVQRDPGEATEHTRVYTKAAVGSGAFPHRHVPRAGNAGHEESFL